MKIEATNKENLLKSNKEILSNDGFNSLNMRNLALKNNIDLDTIHNYFKTKEELLILTIASISKEFFHFNFMKNSGHFVLFFKIILNLLKIIL
ncbi:MAG: TetR/AcrR family transcriptional regulator [Candidatus Onthovivens sp.]|nr:TetR/AcrR family transcriptional regulator [Candidatus Onthovivens sp.]